MAFPKKTSVNDKRIQLAENHTHYIFVDSMDNSKDLALCRTQFEAYVGHIIGQLDNGRAVLYALISSKA